MTATPGLKRLVSGQAAGLVILLGFYVLLVITFTLLSPFFLTGVLTKPVMAEGFNWIGQGRVLGIPVPALLMLLVSILLALVLRLTHFGRYVYAVGGNPEASRLLGLPVNAVQPTLYVVSALSGALACTMLAAMLGAAAPNAASPHLLTVIAAIILGGTSLLGGRGSASTSCASTCNPAEVRMAQARLLVRGAVK